MKNRYYSFLACVLLLTASCSSPDSRRKVNFTSIEITYGHHNKHQTVHIDSNRIVTWCKYYDYPFIDSTICFRDTISKGRMDTLIGMVDMMKNTKKDASPDFVKPVVYENPPGDAFDRCGGYIVKIGTSQGFIKSMVIGSGNFQNDFKEKDFSYEIAFLARYISKMSIKPNKVDSDYVFETEKFFR